MPGLLAEQWPSINIKVSKESRQNAPTLPPPSIVLRQSVILSPFTMRSRSATPTTRVSANVQGATPATRGPATVKAFLGRLHPSSYTAHVDLSQFTSVTCETILHQPIPARSGPIRRVTTIHSKHASKPYSKPTVTFKDDTSTASSKTTESRSTRSGKRRALDAVSMQSSQDEDGSDEDEDEERMDGPGDHSVPAGPSTLIPKPPGENARPGRSGYSVSRAVLYSQEEWQSIEVRPTYTSSSTALSFAFRNTSSRFAT